jgi:fructokinase
MRKIYGIGEALLDIIFKDGQPNAAKAGGSVLNSVVSMGRLGLPVSFISEYGHDDVGKLIDDFLAGNGVDTSFVNRFEGHNTTLAIAFLDERNDARYSFYKEYPEKRLATGFPKVSKDDILQCGSFYAIWPEIREKFKQFIEDAHNNGALILYDPNFRKSHSSDLETFRPMIVENMQMSGIIRGSDEDFRNIFGSTDADAAWNVVKEYCGCLVYTANAEGVFVRTRSFSGKFDVQKLNPVSTIGAGDNFNAGMLSSIYLNNIGREQLEMLDGNMWKRIISTAVAFASHVCMSWENYISGDFAKEISLRIKE